MSWRMTRNSILAVCATGAAMAMSGCGSSSVNVVTVSVTPSAVTVVAGQVENFTAVVGGSTTLTVAWTCTYVYTPLPTTATPNPVPTKAAPCTSGQTVNGGSVGTWTTSSTNGSNVLTYTAPSLSNFPNPIPILSFIATADADHKKTATGQAGLDSGIRVSITPATATVPVGLMPAQTTTFFPSFLNSPPLNAQFRLMQVNTASKNTLDQSPNPLSDSCTVASPTTTNPGCGSIDNNGVYTAPMTLPTATTPTGGASPTTVYVVVWSSSDVTHFTFATITLVNATTNPVSYSGLYPPTIAAGGVLQDVFLKASNLLNTAQITFISPVSAANLASGSQTPLNNTTQVFTIPISPAYCTPSGTGVTPVVTCDASLLTRVRLLSPQLAQAEPITIPPNPPEPAWIMISNLPPPPPMPPPQPPPGCVFFPGSTTSIACPLHIVNASPGLVAAAPDSFQQGTQNGSIEVSLDGGYYGASSNAVNVTFAGTGVTKSVQSGARRVIFSQDSFQLPSPGLYEATISGNTTQGTPPTFPTATTNIAVQPNFANFNPNSFGASATCIDPTTSKPLSSAFPDCVVLSGSGNVAPSALALNSVGGYAVLAEQGANALQLIDLTGAKPVLAGSPFALLNAKAPTASAPTDFAIDNQLLVDGGDLGVVVSSGDSTLYLYAITPLAVTKFTYAGKVPVDLQTLLDQPGATGLPAPVSFGVDPTTHLGVVVYANTNVAFIVDVNPNLDSMDKHTCFLAGKTPPCVLAPVSVNTGPTPKVILQPNAPLAYVTPGGGNGATSVVNLLQQGKSAQIAPFVSGGTSGAVRTAGTTKIITLTAHGINPILGGTVIISGVTGTKTGASFNGTFQVSQVIDPFSFTYTQFGQNDDVESNTSTSSSGAGLGTVQYGTPYFSFSTSTTVSGAAINPITHTFGYADYNTSSSQIGFISTLDQSLTTLTLTAGSCQLCNPNPSGAPEIGFRSVAFDPFTNVLVAFNPSENSGSNFAGNEISLINPGGPAPVGSANFPSRIIAAINTGQVGTGSYTPSGQTSAVPVYGPMTYDPKTKYVLVANAGSNTLTYMNLDPGTTFQKAHIQDLQLFDPVPPYGVPIVQPPLNTNSPATAPTSCSLTDPAQPCMPQGVRMGQSAKLRILGHGFTSGSGTPVVRLDGKTSIIPAGQTTAVPIPPPTLVTDSEIDVTIPAAFLFAPHDYALDVQTNSSGPSSNAIDLHVVGLLDMKQTGTNGCTPTQTFPQGPEGVAIDESRHIALVTNYACNSVSVISIDPSGALAPYGTIIGNVTVGNNPIGIDVIPRLGYAVVANNGDTPNGTASIIDISNPASPQIVPITTTSGTTTTTTNSVTVGLSPLGVKIDQDRALALVANSGSNTLSSIDLTVLAPSVTGGHTKSGPSATTVGLSGPPTAIAVDPNRAVAAVTSLQNSGTTSVTGGIDVVTLGTTPPIKSSTASVSSLSASLTGIVYDPGDPNGVTSQTGLFYATSTQSNAIYSLNPDTGSVQTIRVGINPYSVGYNYQTGTLLTINSTSNSSSVVDVQNFKMRQTLGISSMSQFAVAVDNFTNTAVIVDQNNNRVVFLAMPK
jgi:DNA-binding beta-propeller fold protein YncE